MGKEKSKTIWSVFQEHCKHKNDIGKCKIKVDHRYNDYCERGGCPIESKILGLVEEAVMFRCGDCLFGYKESTCPMKNRCAEAEKFIMRNLSNLRM